MKTLRSVLTIAGSDSSGGAGIQADIKTITMFGCFATSAITALTAQNTLGVRSILEASPQFLKEEIECVFDDIYPDAVKIGMVSNPDIIMAIAEELKNYKAKNVVLDPVMVATSGSRLMDTDAVKVLKDELFGLADIITPNIPEAQIISGTYILNDSGMEAVGEKIAAQYGTSVLIKGGHEVMTANDLLVVPKDGNFKKVWFRGEKIANDNTHGTGCTLSSAIASCLALGMDMEESVAKAKEYVAGAIAYGLNMGKGSGPLNHMYRMK